MERCRSWFAPAFATFLAATAAQPQDQFRVVTKEHVPDPWPAARVAVSDVDRDGDLDLLAAYPTGGVTRIRLFRNDTNMAKVTERAFAGIDLAKLEADWKAWVLEAKLPWETAPPPDKAGG